MGDENFNDEIYTSPLQINFQYFVTTGNISRKLRNCEGAPDFKKDENFLLTNYKAISVILCMICNSIFKYLSENSLLYEKQFGFQTAHSTKHAILIFLMITSSLRHFHWSKRDIWHSRSQNLLKKTWIIWD